MASPSLDLDSVEAAACGGAASLSIGQSATALLLRSDALRRCRCRDICGTDEALRLGVPHHLGRGGMLTSGCSASDGLSMLDAIFCGRRQPNILWKLAMSCTRWNACDERAVRSQARGSRVVCWTRTGPGVTGYVWTALVLCACACELAEGECAQVHFIPNWTLADSQIVGPSYLAGFYLSLYIGRS